MQSTKRSHRRENAAPNAKWYGCRPESVFSSAWQSIVSNLIHFDNTRRTLISRYFCNFDSNCDWSWATEWLAFIMFFTKSFLNLSLPRFLVAQWSSKRIMRKSIDNAVRRQEVGLRCQFVYETKNQKIYGFFISSWSLIPLACEFSNLHTPCR